MRELNLNKIIQVVKDARDTLKPNGGLLKVEYPVYLSHFSDSKWLVVLVDCKGAYLTFDGSRISKAKLQKVFNQQQKENR